MKFKKVRKLCMLFVVGGAVTATSTMPSVCANGEMNSARQQDFLASEIPAGYPELRDQNGNLYDLGGMEIVIRDWWSPDTPATPLNEYEEAQQEYREWIQETYNFKIKRKAISGWGDTPQDFVDYVSAGGDANNYAFVLRTDDTTMDAVYEGLYYDLATLDCLDFNSAKQNNNQEYKRFQYGDHIYAMYDNCGSSYGEPTLGVFFNKRILKEAGIDPESIYDMQRDGIWTWDKMVEIMDKVQRDTDGDGTIDVFGANCNDGILTKISVFSNNGEFVGRDLDGRYTYNLENPNTLEALDFAQRIFNTYWETPDEQWDQYVESFLNGKYAFMFEELWAAGNTSFLLRMEDDYGFVMFPKGPKANDYISYSSNNFIAIPACYDAERAWKIAFAWNLYTNEAPGYENSDEVWKTEYKKAYRLDERAINETLSMMRMKQKTDNTLNVPDLQAAETFFWNIMPGSDYKEVIADCAGHWKNAIDKANQRVEQLTGMTVAAPGSMFRLYNPNSGEHFYTANAAERNYLASVGWNYEGIAWKAPEKSNIPVYRLYNPNAGDHHYTTNSAERDMLVSLGWNDEGIGWYSDEAEGAPLYRLYNPNATQAGAHHYTTNAAERDMLIGFGWNDEGIGWYGGK